jgi:predicted transcriptional regulator of viral defense system
MRSSATRSYVKVCIARCYDVTRDTRHLPMKDCIDVDASSTIERRLDVLAPSFTAQEARAAGLSWTALYELRDGGRLVELSRGVYRRADATPIAEVDLRAVYLRSPHGMICLVSAMQHWGLTDEMPGPVDLAIPRPMHRPKIDYPNTIVHVFDAGTFAIGRDQVELGPGEPIYISSIERTLVDCLRLRHQIGPDLSYRALRSYLSGTGPQGHGHLLKMADVFRVRTVLLDAFEVLL